MYDFVSTAYFFNERCDYMKINTFGKDERLKFCREYIYKNTSNVLVPFDINLLPIPTTKDGITLHGTEDKLEPLFENMKKGDMVVGYGIPREIKERFSNSGLMMLDVSLDEEFLKDNAILTAEGTIGRILTEHTSAVKDMKIGIIGYGRIGQSLLNLFLFLGAEVVVYTSKNEVRLDLCENGISAINLLEVNTEGDLFCFSGLDILINTAPAKVIPDEAVKMLKECRLIELASGNNIPQTLYYERFSAVPALMYPKSAGFVLGAAVLRILGIKDDNNRR